MSSSSYENDFWIDQYANRVRYHIIWSITFASVAVACLGFWVLIPEWYYLFAAGLEYLCFLGHLKFAFDAQLALKNEMERR